MHAIIFIILRIMTLYEGFHTGFVNFCEIGTGGEIETAPAPSELFANRE